MKLTLKEYTTLFEDLHQGHKPAWISSTESAFTIPKLEEPISNLDEGDEIVSPKFATEDSGIFPLVPKLSFESDHGDNSMFDALLLPEVVTGLLKEFHKRFAGLKSKWTQTFLEGEASHALVVKDLSVLHKASLLLKNTVGISDFLAVQEHNLIASMHLFTEEVKGVVAVQSETHSTIENAIKMQKKFCQTIVEAMEENECHVQEASRNFKTLQDQLTSMNSTMKEFEKRFSIIFPILQDFKCHSSVTPPSSTSVDIQAIQTHLETMQQKLAKLEQDAWTHIGSPNPPPVCVTPVSSPSNLDATILDLKHQVKVLQHRVRGGGVRIGNKVFQSFKDVQVWVKSELPSRLNKVLWAPSFPLPSVDTLTDMVEPSSWMADLDMGEQFLNFPLDVKLRPAYGIDVRPYLAPGRKQTMWLRSERCMMGLLNSPYVLVKLTHLADESAFGNHLDPSNPFQWSYVRLNLPGMEHNNPHLPWVSWLWADHTLAAGVPRCVDNQRPVGVLREDCWRVAHTIASLYGYLGLQVTSRKMRPPSQRPGAWSGAFVSASAPGVGVSCGQEKWDKARRIITDL